MRRFFLLFTVVLIASCAKPPVVSDDIKTEPAFTSEVTDPNLKVIMDEFFKLSAQNNIAFKKKVSIGFSNIDRGAAIGVCTFRQKFREIDLDKDFWAESSWYSKISLVYHEMAHCYCTRDHDFDNGIMYPDNSIKAIIQQFLQKIPFTPMRPAGYLEDSCPKSLMHPTIISDECLDAHYPYYVKEMFARCQPY